MSAPSSKGRSVFRRTAEVAGILSFLIEMLDKRSTILWAAHETMAILSHPGIAEITVILLVVCLVRFLIVSTFWIVALAADTLMAGIGLLLAALKTAVARAQPVTFGVQTKRRRKPPEVIYAGNYSHISIESYLSAVPARVEVRLAA